MWGSVLLRLAEVDFSVSGLPLEDPADAMLVFVVYGLLIFLGLAVDVALLLYLARVRQPWAAYAERLKSRPWTWLAATQFLLLVVGLFTLSLVLQIVMARLTEADIAARPGPWVMAQSLVIHWPGLLVLAFLLARRGWTWGEAFGVRAGRFFRDLGLGVLFYIGVVPLVAFYSWLYAIFLQVIGYEPQLQDVALAITADASPWVQVYLLVLAVMVAPLFEEIIFRGIALPLLARKWGVHAAVLVVSAAFAAIHFHIPSLVALFILAAAFAYAYVCTGSIVVPTVMHAMFNAVNVGLLMHLR